MDIEKATNNEKYFGDLTIYFFIFLLLLEIGLFSSHFLRISLILAPFALKLFSSFLASAAC